MRTKNNKWFTLVEILVVILIMWIIAIATMQTVWLKWMREEIEIRAVKIMAEIEELQFFAISWKWSWNAATSEWELPDSWDLEITWDLTGWIPNADIKSYYTIEWEQTHYSDINIADVANDTYIRKVECRYPNPWSNPPHTLWKDDVINIKFEGVYITEITSINANCSNNPSEILIEVWFGPSTYTSTFTIDRIAWIIQKEG